MKIWRLILFGMMIVLLLTMTAGMAFAQEEPEDDPEVEGESDSQNPVAVFLGEVTGENVIELQEAGYGLGNISKAFYFSVETGDSFEDILADAGEFGWGEIKKKFKEDFPELHGGGLGWLFKANPDLKPGNSNRPAWAGPKDKGEDWTGGPPPHAGPKDKSNED
jgi:hypothetical protein